MDLVVHTPKGYYVPQADVYIDAWKPVKKTLVSHGHADHAYAGHGAYLCTPITERIIKSRISQRAPTMAIAYHKKVEINGVSFSFIPAGHIPGSAMIFITYKGEKWLYSGDYKLHLDHISLPFEAVHCHTFITECTFGLPIYRWPNANAEAERLAKWAIMVTQNGFNAVIMGYSLGKAQRLLLPFQDVASEVYAHQSVVEMNAATQMQYSHVKPFSSAQPPTKPSVIIIPPNALNALNNIKTPCMYAGASGWYAVKSKGQSEKLDAKFILSDHADYQELQQAIKAINPETVIPIHGNTAVYSALLDQNNIHNKPIQSLSIYELD